MGWLSESGWLPRVRVRVGGAFPLPSSPLPSGTTELASRGVSGWLERPLLGAALLAPRLCATWQEARAGGRGGRPRGSTRPALLLRDPCGSPGLGGSHPPPSRPWGAVPSPGPRGADWGLTGRWPAGAGLPGEPPRSAHALLGHSVHPPVRAGPGKGGGLRAWAFPGGCFERVKLSACCSVAGSRSPMDAMCAFYTRMHPPPPEIKG